MSVDGDAKSSRVLELREILSAETNLVKEASLVSLKKKYPSLDLWIRDSVCACQFAEGVVRYRLLGRFHLRNHKRDFSRAKFNPDTPAN